MSRESCAQWIVIAGTALIAGLLMARYGLVFPAADTIPILLTAIVLGGGASYYHYRGVESFVLCLHCLLRLTTYTVCYTMLMYSVGAMGAPWIDAHLVSFDESIGVYLPAIVRWSNSHSEWQQILQLAYYSLLPQTALTVVVLGFANNHRLLNGFMREFMIGTLLSAIIFSVMPAEGPFVAYGFTPSSSQTQYLQHIHQLREGTRTVITWDGAEGLITFPSFHTAWALLLAWSLRERRVLLAASCLLNGAVIVSTMTSGWHYFADVAAGAGTAVFAIALSAQWAAQWATRESLAAHSHSSTPITSDQSTFYPT